MERRPSRVNVTDCLFQGPRRAYRVTKVGLTCAQEQFWSDALPAITNDSIGAEGN